jgi:predicted metalloprotease with PDZ domain
MYKKTFTIISCLLLAIASIAQNPLKHWTDAFEIHYSADQPVINYVITVDTTDLSSITVEMQLLNIRDTFDVAMVAHPEYDDRYWRFVEDMHIETKNGSGQIVRRDSALWHITIPCCEAVLHYRIHLPKPITAQRAAWRPFLSSTGGLTGGTQTFMYIAGQTLAPSYVRFNIPDDWQIATGLEATADPHIFFAPSVAVLTDCPALIGKFKTWSFVVDGVPHRIVYWPLPNAIPFDSVTLVTDIRKLVQQADSFFYHRLPYREYSFLFEDGAYGALEHSNSVTIGMPSADLAKDPAAYLNETAHEYFHLWNLVRIRPVEWGDVSYRTPAYSKNLWWSEGMTMYYADLLLRRAGLPAEDSSRIKHLEGLIRGYFGSTGNHLFSAERVSQAAYGPPGMLGDYTASTHLQGELLGTMIDIFMRDRSNGILSIDAIMRIMMIKFSGEKGFNGKDIEKLLHTTDMYAFFENYIRGNKTIDFNKYLEAIGLQYKLTWAAAVNDDGKPAADLRIYPWQKPGEAVVRIGIADPSGSWGKAGLHTGDIITAINGSAIKERNDVWKVISKVQAGDTLVIGIKRTTGTLQTKVIVSGYQQPIVKIEMIKGGTEKQKRLYAAWASGN